MSGDLPDLSHLDLAYIRFNARQNQPKQEQIIDIYFAMPVGMISNVFLAK
jgi:hypothetical protein